MLRHNCGPGTKISVDGFKCKRHTSSKGTLRRFLVVRLVTRDLLFSFLRCLVYQVLIRQSVSDNSRTQGKKTLKVDEDGGFCSVALARRVSFTVLLLLLLFCFCQDLQNYSRQLCPRQRKTRYPQTS